MWKHKEQTKWIEENLNEVKPSSLAKKDAVMWGVATAVAEEYKQEGHLKSAIKMAEMAVDIARTSALLRNETNNIYGITSESTT